MKKVLFGKEEREILDAIESGAGRHSLPNACCEHFA